MSSSEKNGCDRFEKLADGSVAPVFGDLLLLKTHPRECPTGHHSDATLERRLGLRAGALRKGDPSGGQLSRLAMGHVLCSRVRYGAAASNRIAYLWRQYELLAAVRGLPSPARRLIRRHLITPPSFRSTDAWTWTIGGAVADVPRFVLIGVLGQIARLIHAATALLRFVFRMGDAGPPPSIGAAVGPWNARERIFAAALARQARTPRLKGDVTA